MTQAYLNYLRFCKVANIEGLYLHNNLSLDEQEQASRAFEKLAIEQYL